MARLVGTLLAFWPAAAQACAVCGSTMDVERNRIAFLGTTIFLSLLPLGMIAGALLLLRRSARGRLAAEFEDRDAAPCAPPARERRSSPAGALAGHSGRPGP